MPKNQPTAAQKARRIQAVTGGAYTDILRGLASPATAGATLRADAWLTTILNHLQELGWPASPLDLEWDRYHASSGPVALEAGRDVDDIDAEADDADPDDPRWSGAPLWLGRGSGDGHPAAVRDARISDDPIRERGNRLVRGARSAAPHGPSRDPAERHRCPDRRGKPRVRVSAPEPAHQPVRVSGLPVSLPADRAGQPTR